MIAGDGLSALDAAACIFAITEFISELLAISPVSNNILDHPSSSSLDGSDDGNAIQKTLEKLRIALFKNAIQIPSATYQSFTIIRIFRPSSYLFILALGELVSSQHVAAALLEGVASALWSLLDELRSRPWGTATRACLRSRFQSTRGSEKHIRLSYAVTRQVNAILR